MSHLIANIALGLAKEKALKAVGRRRANTPPAIWHGALPTNAGGVLVFNLTDHQTAFEVRIWESNVLNATQLLGAAAALDFSTTTTKCSLLLEVWTDDSKPGGPVTLSLCIPQGEGNPEKKDPLSANEALGPRAIRKIQPPDNRTHWLSYDRAHERIKYGKGYHMEETTEYTWDLSNQLTPEQIEQLFGNEAKMATFTCPQGWSEAVGGGVEDARAFVELDRLPLTKNRPPKVKDSSTLTLEDLDEQNYTFSADLPEACQVLYKNVAGANMLLDDELAAAISYSIVTKDMTLNKKLEEKSKDFGYLRVTLGNERGDGPGIPYVLEIWPGGSRSPIHNHGNVCAVIKVLHGEIQVNVYNKLTELLEHKKEDPSRVSSTALNTGNPAPITAVHLSKGDVTWMDSNWYQCHQLINPAKDRGSFCATIQCYKYEDQDRVVWPGFDYIEGMGHDSLVHLFRPDSDFTYGDMKLIVLEEYLRRPMSRHVNVTSKRQRMDD
ncbi:hypothetical protein Vretimale_10873 [Volvox reticuliferus]|uniref:Cysteine dioxygenase n=1 Tax=Volvox reticuliferus TaxID=1737510 RepID=A0A8J4GGT7_9CHLO|nr:hypothetical protein Vretifemale_12582 [Volvox reticuliferus]GIM06593.1 hypothetical protein Vretimale_10873 [Volvox reticuliferus]